MILLDTHVLVWLQREPRKLSRLAEATIRRARSSGGLAVSAITPVELAGLLMRGRLRAADTAEGTIRQFVDEIEVLPLTREIAIVTSHFPHDMLPDPMDRMIAATARVEGIPLLTADQRIQNCPLVKTIW